jgi:leucyl/phenylalanyl-tRNA--protein transferase
VPVYALPGDHVFPDPRLAEPSGLLAIGGDLHPERLLLGYAMGIFPWYSEGQPILWHSPDPRFVVRSAEVRVNRTLRQQARKRPYELTLDRDFRRVIARCQRMPRAGQDGTWITDEMLEAYCELHRLGFAHSAEAWLEGELVGGLYGVCLGGVFFGESMFAVRPDASKLSFSAVARQLEAWGVELIDSQVYTDHLARFGAEEVDREHYLAELERLVWKETRKGRWSFDGDPYEPVAAPRG